MGQIYRVSDRETISSVSASVGFTSAKLSPAKGSIVYTVVQTVDGGIRYTIEGTTPTSSLGFKLLVNSSVEIWGTEALSKFRAIDDGGTAKLEVAYMGVGL